MEYNIVLDLDGTLIDSHEIFDNDDDTNLASNNEQNGNPKESFFIIDLSDHRKIMVYKRPFVEEFIQYCFDNFKNVGFWSAGEKEYVERIVATICTNSFENKKPAFVWSRNDCIQHFSPKTYEKPLWKIYHDPIFNQMGFQEDNTFIVEDNPHSCIYNLKQSIIVPTYSVTSIFCTKNYELKELVDVLKSIF